MQAKRILICLSLILLLSGCRLLLGIKNSSFLTDDEILKEAETFRIPANSLYKVDTGKFSLHYQPLKINDPNTCKEILQPLQVISFSSEGVNNLYLVNCNVGGWPLEWNQLNTFDSFPLRQGLFRKPMVTTTLDEQLDLLVPISTAEVSRNDLRNADEIIIVYWAAFMGKHTRQLTGMINSYVQRFSEKRIKVLWVNSDHLLANQILLD